MSIILSHLILFEDQPVHALLQLATLVRRFSVLAIHTWRAITVLRLQMKCQVSMFCHNLIVQFIYSFYVCVLSQLEEFDKLNAS